MRLARPLLAAVLTVTAATAVHAGWKEDMKKAAEAQAQQRMEKSLGLPQAAPANAKAYFVNLKEGDTLTSPVNVVFGLKNMGVAPTGSNVVGTGHFVLLVDAPTVNFAAAIPKSEQVRHFDGGQIETDLTLKPGKHSLQLVMADWKNLGHNPLVQSTVVNVTVK